MAERPPQVIRQCTNPACAFRFPVLRGSRAGLHCPRCGWETGLIELEASQPLAASPQTDYRGTHLSALLDNIRSTFNVGAMFRTADGVGLDCLHLCGTTATPGNPKLSKTALGAEAILPWTYHPNAVLKGHELRDSGHALWALELHPSSISIFEAVRDPLPSPLVLVVGNEVSGVDPELLAFCDRVVSIPMLGSKGSLNVAIAFGVAIYTLHFGTASSI